jgi:hypothetical protein
MPFPFAMKRTVYFAPCVYYIRDLLSGREGRKTHKAVPDTPNLLKTLLLQPRNTLFNNRINPFGSMRVIATSTLRHPSHEVKALMTIQAQRITIEQVRDKGVVAISCVLVGHELRVLPNADHIRQEQDRSVFVHRLSCRFGDVGFDAADFDAFASWLTPDC